jgi:hypothetical protein
VTGAGAAQGALLAGGAAGALGLPASLLWQRLITGRLEAIGVAVTGGEGGLELGLMGALALSAAGPLAAAVGLALDRVGPAPAGALGVGARAALLFGGGQLGAVGALFHTARVLMPGAVSDSATTGALAVPLAELGLPGWHLGGVAAAAVLALGLGAVGRLGAPGGA